MSDGWGDFRIWISVDIRQSLTEAGVTVLAHAQSMDLESAPLLIDFFANLLVWKDWHSTCPPETAAQLVGRWLRPDGGGPMGPQWTQDSNSTDPWPSIDRLFGRSHRRVSEDHPWFAGGRGTSHQYGNAANGAYAGESPAASSTRSEVQWLGRLPQLSLTQRPQTLAPFYRRPPFVQGLNRRIALDAYNGTILWSKELPRCSASTCLVTDNWGPKFTAMEGAWENADSGELAAR